MSYKPRSIMEQKELAHSRELTRKNTANYRNRHPTTEEQKEERRAKDRIKWRAMPEEWREKERQRLAALPKNPLTLERRKNALIKQRLKFTGCSQEQFDLMIVEQNGKCFICEGDPSKGKSLAADHCHITGKLGRLLCYSCNAGLGMFKDNTRLMEKAITYLKEYR